MTIIKSTYYLLYWSSYFIILVLLSAIYDGDIIGGIYLNLTRFPVLMLCSYLIFNLISNQSSLSNFQKGFLIFFCLVLSVLISRLIFAYLVFPYHFASDYSFDFFNWYRILSQLVIFIAGIGAYGLLIYYTEKEHWKTRQQDLLASKKIAELNFLRAQVQPHFLHNCLNGIYHEIIKKSDQAGEMVIKLSEFMRFMLKEGQKELIPLSAEMDLIENYLDLEMLRFGKQLKIKASISEEFLDDQVPPLLFFSLIENSIKHGVSYLASENCIKYELTGNPEQIIFSVQNALPHESPKRSLSDEGIGLSNLKRQLELLFDSSFEYKQEKMDNHFVSIIKIPRHA